MTKTFFIDTIPVEAEKIRQLTLMIDTCPKSIHQCHCYVVEGVSATQIQTIFLHEPVLTCFVCMSGFWWAWSSYNSEKIWFKRK